MPGKHSATATSVSETEGPVIFIKGARSNNLKDIDLAIPKNRFVVVTGVSGSGKSSLTMDTLFAEGQRRYVESLSSYARQFLMRMKKPDLDYIKGICPAIAVEQKVSTGNARSTVGTLTETYDFLRLLYARTGRPHSPLSGQQVKKHEVADVSDYIHSFPEGHRVQLFITLPFKYRHRTLAQELGLLLQKGYTRFQKEGQLQDIQDFLESGNPVLSATLGDLETQDTKILVLIDRFTVRHQEEDNKRRVADSVQTAFYESEGACLVDVEGQQPVHFSNRFELDGISFPEPSPQLFNFNNPFGACPACEGFSQIMGIDEDKVIPDKSLSVYSGAVACRKGEKNGLWLEHFLQHAHRFSFPVHTPYRDLNKEQRKLLWHGNEQVEGIYAFFRELEEKLYKVQNRVMLARYRGRTLCPTCEGGRLRKEATYVTIAGKNIPDLINIPVEDLSLFFENLSLNAYETFAPGNPLPAQVHVRAWPRLPHPEPHFLYTFRRGNPAHQPHPDAGQQSHLFHVYPRRTQRRAAPPGYRTAGHRPQKTAGPGQYGHCSRTRRRPHQERRLPH